VIDDISTNVKISAPHGWYGNIARHGQEEYSGTFSLTAAKQTDLLKPPCKYVETQIHPGTPEHIVHNRVSK